MPRGEQENDIFAGELLRFAGLHWRESVVGFLLGAVVGFASPTAFQIATKLTINSLRRISVSGPAVAVWPKHGVTTIAAMVVVALCFYGIRFYIFARRFWKSWRAGLVSGIGVVWFLTSGVTFVLLNVKGSYEFLFLFGVGVGCTALVCYRDARSVKKGEGRPEADPDRPIADMDDDILNRGTVVASMVRAIVDDRVPVIALTGPYGDGKTSVLNLLSRELGGHEDVLSVRFSTWLPMDDKALVATLLGSVVEKLETRLFVPKIKRDFVEFARTLFAVLPGLPGSIKDLLEKPSQDEQIGQLQRHLSRLPLRVAVLLDDMDRMQRNELDVLFKIIRGVPEFPQLTYVCAFHSHALIETLRKDSTEDSREEARRFLEKFFPDEIPLPHIEEAVLAVEFEKRFYAICERNHLLTEADERKKFEDEFRTLWEMYLKGFLTNLRRLKLFVNRLNRSLPVIGHEVNLRDLALLELVRMINPVIYEEIYRNARYFMFAPWRFTAWLQIVSADEKEAQEKRNAYYKTLFKDLQRPPEGTLLSLLKELFPGVDSFLSGRDIPVGVAQNAEEAERQRRIYHPDFFPRYFILQVPQDLFGEQEVSRFVAAMNGGSEVADCIVLVKKKYEELQSLPMKRWDFLRRTRAALKRFRRPALEALPLAMAELSDRFETEQFVAVEGTTARAIVFAAANELADGDGAQRILERVLEVSASERFALEVLNDCINKKDRVVQDWSKIDGGRLEAVFRERMRARYGEGGKYSLFPANGQVDIIPLGRWGLSGADGKGDVHRYLRKEFDARHSNVGKFLVLFFPAVPIDPTVDPRAQDPVGTIRRVYFPPEELLELIDGYGDSAYASPDEARAIQEFKLRQAIDGTENT